MCVENVANASMQLLWRTMVLMTRILFSKGLRCDLRRSPNKSGKPVWGRYQSQSFCFVQVSSFGGGFSRSGQWKITGGVAQDPAPGWWFPLHAVVHESFQEVMQIAEHH